PSASRSRASAAGVAPCSGTRFSPATRSSSVAPPAGAAASKASANAASIGERIAAYRTRAGSRRATAPPGRDERWGVWGPSRGPVTGDADRGAPRLRRGATSEGGFGGHLGAPLPATLIEAGHGAYGAWRAMGGIWLLFRAPHLGCR